MSKEKVMLFCFICNHLILMNKNEIFYKEEKQLANTMGRRYKEALEKSRYGLGLYPGWLKMID